MIHKTDEAQVIFEVLKKLNLNFVIAGGYPRDLANFQEPRDMDIFVYNLPFQGRNEVINEIQTFLKSTGWDAIAMLGYDGLRNDIYAVLKTTVDIDIIFCEVEMQSELSVTDSFDYNINQYILDLTTGKPVFVGHCPETLLEVRLESYRSDRWFDRKNKMINKAKECGWDITCLEKTNQTL